MTTNQITYTIRTSAGPVELIHVEVEVGELRHDGHYDIEVHATVNRQTDHFGINSPNVSITEALAAVQSVWPTNVCIDVLRGRYDFLPPYDGDCAQAWEDACNGGMDTTDEYISGEAVGRLIVHSDVRVHDMHREW